MYENSPEGASKKAGKALTIVAGEAGEAGELLAVLPAPDWLGASLVDGDAITVADESEAKLWMDDELESRLDTSNQRGLAGCCCCCCWP